MNGDNAYDSAKSYVSARLKEYYKDALLAKHVFAYAIGHLANDLVINVWNTYSTWYMNQVINMSDYDAGMVVLVGQVVDAFGQTLMGWLCDKTETRIGKRMPWYLFGHLFTVPCFYLIFNPPSIAVYTDNAGKIVANVMYFMVVPSMMNIGQGAIQLSHMSIVNSISYD